MKTTQQSLPRGPEQGKILKACAVLLTGILIALSAPVAAWAQQAIGSVCFVNQANGSDAVGYFDRYGYFHQTFSHPPSSVFKGVTHLVNTSNGVLAYNASTGVATVVQIKDDGYTAYRTVVLSVGWDSIVSVGDYLFFYKDDGSGAIGQIGADGSYSSGLTYSKGAFSHWTHVAATSNNLFFYNSTDGSAAAGFIDHGAFVSTQALPPGSLPLDYSYIVADGNYLLLYNQQTGSSLVGVMDGRPGTFLSRATVSLSAGYSKLVKHDRYVLLYNQTTGDGTIGYFDRVSAAKFIVTQHPAFSANWTRIVSTNDDLLFYNSVTGAGAVGQINSSGQFHQTPQSLSFSAGWFGVVATTR